MAAASVPPPTTVESPDVPVGLAEGMPYRLSAGDYFRMVNEDILTPGRRIGLWEGRLYEKMAKKLPHTTAQDLVHLALNRVVPDGWFVSADRPILVDDFTAPLPDLSVVRGDPNVYYRRGTVPKVDEIGLVVEVADASLRKNLTETLRAYARAGLPCYWVVNLVAKRVEVYADPGAVGQGAGAEVRYTRAEAYEPGKDVPLVLDGRAVARIPAADLLPRADS